MRSANSLTAPSPPFFLQTYRTTFNTGGMPSAGEADKPTSWAGLAIILMVWIGCAWLVWKAFT